MTDNELKLEETMPTLTLTPDLEAEAAPAQEPVQTETAAVETEEVEVEVEQIEVEVDENKEGV